MLKAISRRNISHYRGEFSDIWRSVAERRLKDGPAVDEFEKRFAKYIGAQHAVAVGSGRLGLYLILTSLSLEKGSEIIAPSYTDESVPGIIIEAGLNPVFVDIERDTHNIDANLIERKITSRSRAIIATHLFGRPCDLTKISGIANRYNLFVIEDCAHAIGAEYNSQRVGTFGIASYFSFGITKPFNTFGGGMIVTNKGALYGEIRKKTREMPYPAIPALIKNISISYFLRFLTGPAVFSALVFPLLLFLSLFNRDVISFYNRTMKKAIGLGRIKVRYANVQALVGLKQLEALNVINERRLRNAGFLSKSLDKGIRLLKDSSGAKSTYYFFVITGQDISALSRRLLSRGIDTGRHLMRDCSSIYSGDGKSPLTKEALQKSLQVPVYPELDADDIQYIAGAINQAYKQKIFK